MRLYTLRIEINFLKDPGFCALVGCKTHGSNETGECLHKRQFFSIIVRIVYKETIYLFDPGRVSPCFRVELIDVGTTKSKGAPYSCGVKWGDFTLQKQ
ncbi:hypothetical protein AMTRI_Chr12g239430 [Amborella trichopoda]